MWFGYNLTEFVVLLQQIKTLIRLTRDRISVIIEII